jgi:hypothetical protein
MFKKIKRFSVLSTFIFNQQEEKEGKQVSGLEIFGIKSREKVARSSLKRRGLMKVTFVFILDVMQ